MLIVKRFLILICVVVLSSCTTQYIPVDTCPPIPTMDSWITVEDLYVEYIQLKALHKENTKDR